MSATGAEGGAAWSARDGTVESEAAPESGAGAAQKQRFPVTSEKQPEEGQADHSRDLNTFVHADTGENQNLQPPRDTPKTPETCEALEVALGAAREKIRTQDVQIQELTRALSQAQAHAADSLSKLTQRIQDLVERDEQLSKLEKEALAAKEEIFNLKRSLEASNRAREEYEGGLQGMAAVCEEYRRALEKLRETDISRAERRVSELETRMLAFSRDEVLMRYLEELESLRSRLRDSSVRIIELSKRQKELEAELRVHSAASQKLRSTRHPPSKAVSLPVAEKKVVRSAAEFSQKDLQKGKERSLQPSVPKAISEENSVSTGIPRHEALPPEFSHAP